jgi:mannose-6-phosphate isomerase-like protein (cupin superfamily)
MTHAGFVSFDPEGMMHDEHYHTCNEWYFIAGGIARLKLGEERPLVGRGDVVLIPKGMLHDILETYGEEPFSLFYLYEPEEGMELAGHLHTDDFPGPHPVPHFPLNELDQKKETLS